MKTPRTTKLKEKISSEMDFLSVSSILELTCMCVYVCEHLLMSVAAWVIGDYEFLYLFFLIPVLSMLMCTSAYVLFLSYLFFILP